MTRRYLTQAALRDLEAQLSEIDLSIIKSVSDLRFTSGAQLHRLHFAEGGNEASRTRATRRALQRLADLDCLVRLPRMVGGVRAGSQGFVYTLGMVGQKIAINQGWQPIRRSRRPSVPGTLFLHHCLLVAELHVQLIEADRSRRLELIELEAEPGCHRGYGGLGRQRILKPDSFLRFGLGEFEFVFFIEVDRATHGSQAVARKLEEYLSYERSGIEQEDHGVFPKALWLVPDVSRAEVIEREIEQLPRRGRELFGVALFKEAISVMTSPDLTKRT